MLTFAHFTAQAYPKLHQHAQRLLRHEAVQPYSAHDLLHDAYLRLATAAPRLNDNAHGHCLYASTMRRLLIDRARQTKRLRHGGHLRRVPLPTDEQAKHHAPNAAARLATEMLAALERVHAGQAQVLRLCQLEGYKQAEVAAALSVSKATVKRWKRTGQAVCAAYLRADGLA
ncbi:MAG: sigma-70 family RNA polymerase sigma factor [Bacteroidota bacterium]